MPFDWVGPRPKTTNEDCLSNNHRTLLTLGRSKAIGWKIIAEAHLGLSFLTLLLAVRRSMLSYPRQVRRSSVTGVVAMDELGARCRFRRLLKPAAIQYWLWVSYTPRRWGVTWCYIGRFVRDMYENTASAVRCDMVLHRVFRARHL